MGYKLTVEVPLGLCCFAFYLLGYLIVNLNIYKVCYNIYEYPEEDCLRLGRYTDNATLELEKIVQPYAGMMSTVTELVPVTVPILLSLMVGAWSDKYGRKPVLLTVIICQTVGFALNTILLSFKNVNPWWLMIGSAPNAFTGGLMTFYSVMISYMNDMSTEDNRAMRMVLLDIIQTTTSLAGGLASSFLLYATSYVAVWTMCTLILATAAAYTYFFCPESLKNREKPPNYKKVFKLNNLTDLLQVAKRKREANKKPIIFLIMGAIIVLNFISSGESNVKTLYFRNSFSWTLTQKNVFGAWSTVLCSACTFVSTYLLHTKLKIKESYLVILAIVSLVGGTALYTFGTDDSYIFASAGVGAFGSLSTPMLRTMLAKHIFPEEMGKIFSLVMVINTIGMLIAALVFQQIYNSTIRTHPEAFNYLCFALYGVSIVVILIVMVYESRFPKEEQTKKVEVNVIEVKEK